MTRTVVLLLLASFYFRRDVSSESSHLFDEFPSLVVIFQFLTETSWKEIFLQLLLLQMTTMILLFCFSL